MTKLTRVRFLREELGEDIFDRTPETPLEQLGKFLAPSVIVLGKSENGREWTKADETIGVWHYRMVRDG